MNEQEIERIPIAEIRVANPRSRSQVKFQLIVSSIILRAREAGRLGVQKRRTTAQSLVQEYEQHIREKKKLIKRATVTRDRLLMLTSAIRELMVDENFLTLLRAENLADMPEQLVSMLD